MSTPITTEDVKKLARLSALDITEPEADAFRGELEAILEFVRQLDAVDTTGLEPTYQVNGLENVMRDDAVIDYGLDRDALLANAPASQDGHIKVPKVLGD